MDFRIRQLQCFLTLAEHLHYGRTARALYMSQPTITFQIKSLEQSFGVALFERSRRQVALTHAGEAFRGYAASIVGTVAEARRHMGAVTSRMHLTISCGHLGAATLLPAVLRSCAQHHPGFTLDVDDMTPAEQRERLAAGTLDALLMVTPMPLQGMRFECLQEEPLVAILSRRSPLAERRRISVEDLRHVPLIAPRLKDCAMRQPFLQTLLAPYGVIPHFVEAPHTGSAQMAYVAADQGLLIGTRLMARDQAADVVARPFKESLPRLQLGLASMLANTSPAMIAFRSLVLACAGETAPRTMPHARAATRSAIPIIA